MPHGMEKAAQTVNSLRTAVVLPWCLAQCLTDSSKLIDTAWGGGEGSSIMTALWSDWQSQYAMSPAVWTSQGFSPWR